MFCRDRGAVPDQVGVSPLGRLIMADAVGEHGHLQNTNFVLEVAVLSSASLATWLFGGFLIGVIVCIAVYP